MHYFTETWRIRSVPGGHSFSSPQEQKDRYHMKSLHWVTGGNGSRERQGRNSDIKMEAQKGRTLRHHLFVLPGPQMERDQNPGACFL